MKSPIAKSPDRSLVQSSRDALAEIAAGRVELRDRGLIEPAPVAVPARELPIGPSRGAGFAREPGLQTAAELKRELARMRRRYAPFQRDLAPRLPSLRRAMELRDFQWRLDEKGRGWQRVRVPHYGGPVGVATAFYRTTVEVTAAMRARGSIFLRFGAVDYQAHVFWDGRYVGSHEGFFAPFEFDITDQATPGRHTLLVRVDNAYTFRGEKGADGVERQGDKIYAATGLGWDDPELGWHHCPPGMGICQPVHIEARATVHVGDVFVRPLLEEDAAEVWLDLRGTMDVAQVATARLTIVGQNFRATVCRDLVLTPAYPIGRGANELRVRVPMPGARRWSPDTPWLYQAQVRVFDADGRLLDTARRQFGMRSFRIDESSTPKGRLHLNGDEIRLRGANTMGHEQQCVFKRDWGQLRDDILLAKIAHMNFLRITQRPVEPEVYEACDRLGLMVQTDLPLFGVMRRPQWAEGVRQCVEMETLVRAHACAVITSYINEPFPAEWNVNPQRFLTRAEMERWFLACDEAIHLANPDRVIKPIDGDYDPPGPGLPDNHCYNGWYNGHMIDLGRMHKGYWQRVKPGWMYGCGEFGAEGLDPVGVMRRHYPKAWLPASVAEEAGWSPSRIVRAQTGELHCMWFEAATTVAEWVRRSQAHQAWIVRLQAEAFRRDARMNTFAVHLFIDAFPSGWMKTIMDVERAPKPAYFAYRDALTPLMVNLRGDRHQFFGGETAAFEAWICNDLHTAPAGAVLRYQLEEADGRVLQAGRAAAAVPLCSSRCQGTVPVKLPPVTARRRLTLRLALMDRARRSCHQHAVEFDVFPASAEVGEATVRVLEGKDSPAARLLAALGVKPARGGRIQDGETVVLSDAGVYAARRREIDAAVRRGARLVLLGLPAGAHATAAGKVEIKTCGMGLFHFAGRDSGHACVEGFTRDDFRFWYDEDVDMVSPILHATLTGEGWVPILTSGNGGWGQSWHPALAAAEKPVGRGQVRICQVQLHNRVRTSPVARLFAQRLLGRA